MLYSLGSQTGGVLSSTEPLRLKLKGGVSSHLPKMPALPDVSSYNPGQNS